MSTLVNQVSAITEAEFCKWLGSARPGDSLSYHRGHLVIDCAVAAREKKERPLRRLAARAYAAAEAGLVDLVQRRHGVDDYEYIAIARRRPPRPGGGALGRVIREAVRRGQ